MDIKEYKKRLEKINTFYEQRVVDLKLERLGDSTLPLEVDVIVTQHSGKTVIGRIKFIDIDNDGEFMYIVHKILKSGKASKHPIAYSLFQYYFKVGNIKETKEMH